MKRHIIILFIAALVSVQVFGEAVPSKVKPTRNLIVLLTDGTSTGALSLARWYKQYTLGTTDNLALDPYICGLVRMSHADSPIVGSAGSMTTLMTGLLVKSRNIDVYPKADPKNDMTLLNSARAYHPLVNLMDVAREEQGKSLGVVVTTIFNHATPAATAAHAYNRNDYEDLATQMAGMNLDVCFGGGAEYLSPKVRSILQAEGTALAESYEDFRSSTSPKLWAIMAKDVMDYDLDRTADEPSLAEMTTKALDILSHNNRGFMLMVEGSRVDYAAHANDPIALCTDLLAFDDAVRVALDFARRDGNTTVVILTDHGNSGVTLGDKHYGGYSEHNIKTVLGSLPDCRLTSEGIVRILDGKPASELHDIIERTTGIQLTEKEEKRLVAASGVKEDDYMKVGDSGNLQAAIAELITKHSHIGFVSGHHTGEDVFISIYNPHNQRPEGFITNQQVNDYLRRVMGIKQPLDSFSRHYFVAHDRLFSRFSVDSDQFGDAALNVTLPDGRTAIFSANSCIVNLEGKLLVLKRPIVYIRETGIFFLPEDIIKQLCEKR